MDPNYKDVVPWKPRGYQRKRPHGHQLVDQIKQSHDDHMGERTQEKDRAQANFQGGNSSKTGLHVEDKEIVWDCVSPDSHGMMHVRESAQNVANVRRHCVSPDSHMMHVTESALSVADVGKHGVSPDSHRMAHVREPAQSVAVVGQLGESPDSHMTGHVREPEALFGKQNVLKLD